MSFSVAELRAPEVWSDVSNVEHDAVVQMLGKVPQGKYSISVRKKTGEPVVIENAPFFYDGTPMPTRFWLVDPELVAEVSRLESNGGVKRVQDEIDPEVIRLIHESAAQARELLIEENHEGPKPSGGVGGTRKGVKCLHTHVANFLATGDDAVGAWTLDELEKKKVENK